MSTELSRPVVGGTAAQVAGLHPQQLQVVKRTVAKDLNDIEFSLFMEACRSYQLDPFRRQIIPVVYNGSDEKKRQMVLISTRDGYRVIASRCRDYRPADGPALIEYDDSLKGDDNPLGIVRAQVTLWKLYGTEWFPVVGEAYWDEYAPLTFSDAAYEYVDTGDVWPDSGRPKKRKVLKDPKARKTLDTSGQWGKMPRVMIAKCAEVAALRAGWPDSFAGLYAQEEIQSGMAEQDAYMTAAEAVEHQSRLDRQARTGGPGLAFFIGNRMERFAYGECADRILEVARDMTDEQVYSFLVQNETQLRELWAHDEGQAWAVKKALTPRSEAYTKSLQDADRDAERADSAKDVTPDGDKASKS